MIGEPVYVRGFLKNYARLLGLNPADLTRQLDEEYQAIMVPTAEASQTQRDASTPIRWYPWLLGTMTSVAGVLILLVIWNLFGIVSRAHEGAVQPPLPATQVNANTAQAPRTIGVADAAAVAALGHHGIDLRLELTADSWLSVTVDGKRMVYKTLPAGSIRQFHGTRQILLRAGNAGGVIATIDGRQIGALGGPGEVQDRSFAVKPPPQENRTHE